MNKNNLNDLIRYNIGKTSLNYFLDNGVLNNNMENIKKEFTDSNVQYQKFYLYLKDKFIDALNNSVKLVLENENINKISINDEIIKYYMNLFDKLGFTIRLLTDEELEYLFSDKKKEDRDKLKYYAYFSKNKYLSIFEN